MPPNRVQHSAQYQDSHKILDRMTADGGQASKDFSALALIQKWRNASAARSSVSSGCSPPKKVFMETETKQPAIDNRLRRYANWGIVLGTALWACYFVGFLVYHSLRSTTADNSWLLQIIAKHYAAAVGVPLSAISAFCIVLLLQVVVSGPIELEALGFKFRGAAGPVVLWIFCFLAMVFGVYLLWGK